MGTLKLYFCEIISFGDTLHWLFIITAAIVKCFCGAHRKVLRTSMGNGCIDCSNMDHIRLKTRSHCQMSRKKCQVYFVDAAVSHGHMFCYDCSVFYFRDNWVRYYNVACYLQNWCMLALFSNNSIMKPWSLHLLCIFLRWPYWSWSIWTIWFV